MRRFALAAAAVLLIAAAANAATIGIHTSPPDHNSPGCASGLCIDGLGLDSARYTGWIYMGSFAKIALKITFTDANDSVTALQVRCWDSFSSNTTNGSGYEICSGSTSSGTTTMTCPHTWELTTGTAEQFTLMVDNISAQWLNCWFNATGTPAAADVITVKAVRRTP